MNKIIYTLVFIKEESKILLGLKKRGLGVGKWNGFGGKVENETILEGAIRETKEECNLKVDKLNHVGIVAFKNEQKSQIDVVHVFITKHFTDNLEESEEMKPQWFDISNIPYEKMWSDAKCWIPLMLNNKFFFAYIILDENGRNCKVHQFNSIAMVLKFMENMLH